MNFYTQLLAKRSWNDTLATFTFVKPPTFKFIPGQFVLISSEADPSNPRPFSISSVPDDPYLELSIRKLGEFSSGIHNAKLGSTFQIKGPFGLFTLEESVGDVVMIAGGIGITPFLSMIRYSPNRNLTLLYSIKTEDDIIERESMEKASQNPGTRIIYHYSVAAPEGSGLPIGVIDKAFIESNVQDCKNKAFYLCGPPPMVASLKQALADLGVAEDKVHVDNWDYAKKVAEVNK